MKLPSLSDLLRSSMTYWPVLALPFAACSAEFEQDSVRADPHEQAEANGGGVGASAGSTEGQGSPDASDCRTYAAGATLSVRGAHGALACAFDAQAYRLDCSLSIDGSELTQSRIYASASDFVEEAQDVGKITSLREIQTEDGVERTTVHSYDELGRLTRSVEDRTDGTFVKVFSEYDAAGRPRRAMLSRQGEPQRCAALPLLIAYDSVARTVSTTYQPDGTSDCGQAERTDVNTYDVSGSVVQVREGDDLMVEATTTDPVTVCR